MNAIEQKKNALMRTLQILSGNIAVLQKALQGFDREGNRISLEGEEIAEIQTDFLEISRIARERLEALNGEIDGTL